MLDYYVDRKFAFFHIPKTGGTSVRHLLRNRYGADPNKRTVGAIDRHESLMDKRKALGADEFDSIKIIATIRNPYARIVSLYYFAAELHKKMGGPPPAMPELSIVGHADLKEFVRWFADDWPSIWDLVNINGAIPGNLLFIRLEHLAEDFARVFNRTLGLDLDRERMRHYHKTGMGDRYKDLLDRESLAIISEKEKLFLERGFYEFETGG